ncbi:MAG: DinB family protein [bacterium]|nr:DinB family protein [bacterium]
MGIDDGMGTERELMEARLDRCRAETVRKVSGLGWNLATRRLGSSATSAAGVLKHLTDVERWLFRHYLEGEAEVPRRTREETPNGAFDLYDWDTLDDLIADYELACEESRDRASRHDLSDRTALVVDWLELQPSLRWVYLHMIEETARHNGHLDIYRELLDDRSMTTGLLTVADLESRHER